MHAFLKKHGAQSLGAQKSIGLSFSQKVKKEHITKG